MFEQLSRVARLTGAALVLAATALAAGQPTDAAARLTRPFPDAEQQQWLSGAAGPHVPSGEFGDWRGRTADSVTTWADSEEGCQSQPIFTAGSELGDWKKTTIVNFGGKWGQSWDSAASGGMDQIWTRCLQALKTNWGDRDPSKLIIGLFHEANGTWYPWSVRSKAEISAFKQSFARFRDLQQDILPEAKVVFTLNGDHQFDGTYTMKEMLPAEKDYDYLGVDYYNLHYPFRSFDQFPALAASAGKPLLVPEWGVSQDEAGYMEYMRENFTQHAGKGPGKLEVENYFNLWDEYEIMPKTQSSKQAETYRRLW